MRPIYLVDYGVNNIGSVVNIIKKVELKRFHPNSFNGNRMNLDGTFFTSTVPHLEFSIEFQSNSLIYDK